ncbi:uncharacterized protein VNE69_05169 [Vairimorpha necatrix]|uniref:Uncharacterized protein n=1 Tax=Vairimorpha necatrix TaxID=6039 RepID=A0AAX4JCA8_9MICR
MLFISIFFSQNIQSSTANLSTDKKNREYQKCTNTFYSEESKFNVNLPSKKNKKISNLLLDSILDKMTFPIKMHSEWPKKLNGTEYEILRKDIDYDTFFLHLIFNKELNNDFTGKEKVVDSIMYNLRIVTSKMYNLFFCINFNVSDLNLDILRLIVDKYINVEFTEKDCIFSKIFNASDFNTMFNELRESIGLKGDIYDTHEKVSPRTINELRDSIDTDKDITDRSGNVYNHATTLDFNTGSVLQLGSLIGIGYLNHNNFLLN